MGMGIMGLMGIMGTGMGNGIGNGELRKGNSQDRGHKSPWVPHSRDGGSPPEEHPKGGETPNSSRNPTRNPTPIPAGFQTPIPSESPTPIPAGIPNSSRISHIFRDKTEQGRERIPQTFPQWSLPISIRFGVGFLGFFKFLIGFKHTKLTEMGEGMG